MKTIAQILSIFAFSPLISLAQPSWIDDGLVAEYLFSGNWQDSSNNANNLVPRGAEFGPDRFGNPNGAARFDKTSYASASDKFLPKENGSRTISLWAKREGAPRVIRDTVNNVDVITGVILSYGNLPPVDGYGGSWIEMWDAGAAFDWGIRYVARGGQSFLHSGWVVNETEWVHICYTFNRDVLTMHANGQKVNSVKIENFHTDKDGSLFIGSTQRTVGAGFNGLIDDVRIYNRSLKTSEIAELYDDSKFVFTKQPNQSESTISLPLGVATQLSVDGSALRPITYQWLKNGKPIEGQKNKTLNLRDIFFTDGGSYSVKASTGAVSHYSEEINIIVRNEIGTNDSDGDGIPDNVENRLGTSATSADTDNDTLDDGYELGIGRYELVKRRFNVRYAEKEAGKQGGYLATLTSQHEQDLVGGLVGGFYDRGCWIGLSDKNAEDVWQWNTGEEFQYNNWFITEPNNMGGAENYVQIVGGRDWHRPETVTQGGWHDQQSTSALEGPNYGWALIEYGSPTDPLSSDTDTDGLGDALELQLGLLANDSDTDNDGYLDGEEYGLGFDPKDPASHPKSEVTPNLTVRLDFDNNLEEQVTGKTLSQVGEILFTEDRLGRSAAAIEIPAYSHLVMKGFNTINGSEWSFTTWFNYNELDTWEAWTGADIWKIAPSSRLDQPSGMLKARRGGYFSFHSWNQTFSDDKKWYVIDDYPGGRHFSNKKWNHVAITYKNGKLRYYINNTFGWEREYRDNDTPIESLIIGLGGGLTLDDFRFYSRAITQQEVNRIFSEQPYYITKQPTGGEIEEGSPVILTGETTAAENLSYQWYLDGEELAGETQNRLFIPEIQREQSGEYSLKISQGGFFLETDTASISVVGPPIIIEHPVAGEFEVGQTLLLSALASGTADFQYQWILNGKPFFGATSKELTIGNLSESMTGDYAVKVTNQFGEAISEVANISVRFLDNDGDTIGNWVEISLGTNPDSADTDEDGLRDDFEINESKTNPTSADSDDDGLSDFVEINETKTNATSSDTDLDGLSDGEEVLNKTYPTNPLSADTDGDGLTDKREIDIATDPSNVDTDGDGLEDSDEVEYGYDPNSATEAAEGELEVFRAIELKFFTLPGKTYQLYRSNDLKTWEEVDQPFTTEGGFYSTFVRQEASQVYWKLSPTD